MSNYNVYVDALKKQGYGEEDAKMKALWELYGRAPLEAGFSGFVMGALSGAMVNTSNVFEAGKYADAEKNRRIPQRRTQPKLHGRDRKSCGFFEGRRHKM